MPNNMPDLSGIGFYPLLGEEWKAAREFIINAMVFDKPGYTARLDGDEFVAGSRAIKLDCEARPRRFSLLIVGWPLRTNIPLQELFEAFSSILNADPDTDSIISDLHNRAHGRTLLTNRPELLDAAKRMRSEQACKSRICFDVLTRLSLPTSWRGNIPDDAFIYSTIPTLIGGDE